MASGFGVMGLYDSVALWCSKEPVKLGVASLAIAFIKVSMTSLTPVRLLLPVAIEHKEFMAMNPTSAVH